jgi:hypothetical protein
MQLGKQSRLALMFWKSFPTQSFERPSERSILRSKLYGYMIGAGLVSLTRLSVTVFLQPISRSAIALALVDRQ